MSYIEKQLTSGGYSPRRNYANETSPLKISSSSRNLLGDFTQLRTDLKRKYQGRNSPQKQSQSIQQSKVYLNYDKKDQTKKISLSNQENNKSFQKGFDIQRQQPENKFQQLKISANQIGGGLDVLKNQISEIKSNKFNNQLSSQKKMHKVFQSETNKENQDQESLLDQLNSKIRSSVKQQITTFQKPLFQQPQQTNQNSAHKKSVQQKIKSISPRKRNSNSYISGSKQPSNNLFGNTNTGNNEQYNNMSRLNSSFDYKQQNNRKNYDKNIQFQQYNPDNNFNQIRENIQDKKRQSTNNNNNVDQLLQDQRSQNQQIMQKSFKKQLQNRTVDEIIPLYRIQEMLSVLVDVNDLDFSQLPREYIDQLDKLSAVINFKIKTSDYQKKII